MLAAPRLPFRRFALHLLTLPENFLERPHFRKKHIGRRPPHQSVRPDIVRPEIPGNQIVRLHFEFLQAHQLRERLLHLRRHGPAKFDHLRLLPGHRVGQTVSRHAEVVPDRAFKRDLLERRRPHIATGRDQFQLGRAIRQNLDHERRRGLVITPFRIGEFHVVALRRRQRESGQRRDGLPVHDHEGNLRLLLAPRDQFGRRHRFIELERHAELGALDRAHPARVLDPAGRQRGVAGEHQLRIGPHEPRILEHRDLKIPGALALGIDAVNEIRRDIRHRPAKDRIREALHQRDRARRSAAVIDDEFDPGR